MHFLPTQWTSSNSTLIRESLLQLNEFLNQPTPKSILYASFILPWMIAYLVQLQGTRPFRVVLFPLSILPGVWCFFAKNDSWGPGKSARG